MVVNIMGLVNDLENQVRDFISGNYEVREVDYIPSVENVSLGKKAVSVPLCSYFIDMRNSSDLLFERWKQTSAKIHKVFLTVVSNAIIHYEGRIRSFQGDGVLAFWPAKYKSDVNKAVKAAMVTKWLLSTKYASFFEKYFELDYGIGIDFADSYIIRAGLSNKTTNNDLVFISKSVNFAVEIANQAKGPYNVEISDVVYENLSDDNLYSSEEENMREEGSVEWNGENYETKLTEYHFSLKN